MERFERYLGGRKLGFGDGLEVEREGSFRFLVLVFGWMVVDGRFIEKRNLGGVVGFKERLKCVGL